MVFSQDYDELWYKYEQVCKERDDLLFKLGEEQRKNTELHKECADLRFKLQHWEGQ